jgi:hypothetical protein
MLNSSYKSFSCDIEKQNIIRLYKGGVFIKNIARFLEGLIYILLGVIAATIIIIPFTSLLTNDLAKIIEKITEISLFIIIILLLVPTILNKYTKSSNYNNLTKTVYVLKNIHIALGIMFIGIRILHIEINIIFDPIVWNFEIVTSMLLNLLLIPTVIYGILRINNSEKYRRPHRLFLTLTYLVFIIHLFH